MHDVVSESAYMHVSTHSGSIYLLVGIFNPFAFQIIIDMCAVLVEKEMATHPSTLAWTIPWMEEPRRLQSMQLLRVGQD